jgi:starch synthase
MKKDITVWMLAREYRELAGAGGVQDVVRDLSEAMVRSGCRVRVIIPRYGFMNPGELGFSSLDITFEVDMNYADEERREEVSFWSRTINGVEVLLIEAWRFSEKNDIYTYTAEDEAINPDNRRGTGHYDYFAMNVLHQKAVLGLALATDFRPDIFHCQDGHTAIVPAMMREIDGFRQFFSSVSALVTIHNAGVGYHQEVSDLNFAKANTGLPWRVIYSSQLHGAFDPFLAGAAYCPVNTVSENYARELQETELDAMTGWLGHALLERGITLKGITNGINPAEFDPRRPEELGIPAAFDPSTGDLAGKEQCKGYLIRILSTDRDKEEPRFHSMQEQYPGLTLFGNLDAARRDQPLVTVVGRFSDQKGLDIFAQALEGPLSAAGDFSVAVIGSGKRELENYFAYIADLPAFKGRFAYIAGYSPALANLVYAAGDFFVIPSRYEPCGLTDFIAQLMGNLPVVRATGGLLKVKDGFNGFSFIEPDAHALAVTLRRAIDLFLSDPARIRKMQKDAFENIFKNYTWDVVVKKYLELYNEAMEPRR